MRGAQQSLIRTLNDQLVCDLLNTHGAMSRIDLARHAQVSVPAILKMVARLQRIGVVTEAGSADTSRPGPRASLYRLADYGVITGVNVTDQRIEVSHRTLNGALIRQDQAPIRQDADLAGQLLATTVSPRPGLPQVITVAVAGTVDPRTGSVSQPPGHPGWAPGTAAVVGERSAALSVAVESRAHLLTEAERRTGAAAGRDDFLWVSFGSTIEAGLMLEGSLRRGAGGRAGRIRFAPVLSPGEGPHCHDAASAPAVARALGLEHDPSYAWLHSVLHRGKPADRDTVAACLGPVLLTMATILDPPLIVLAGDLFRIAGEPLLEAMARWLSANREFEPPELRLSTLGTDATLRGAWIRGWHALLGHALASENR